MRPDRRDDPRSAEFWWNVHEREVGLLVGGPFRRNPNDIKEALGMTPEARQAIQDALKAAQRFQNIKQYQAANETAMYTLVARLMDAGILVRPS